MTLETPREGDSGGWLRHGVRAIAAGSVAGGICGVLIGGIGGRLAMRLVVLASPTPPLFDRAASLQLLQQVGYRGVAVGILFVAIRRWLPKWKMGVGVEFGGLLAIGTIAAALLSPWKSEFRQGPLLVGLVLFALLVLGFGIATAWMTAGLERGVARAGDGVVQSLAVSVVAVLGLMMSVLGWVSIIVKDLISS